jgi:hypothetical protein
MENYKNSEQNAIILNKNCNSSIILSILQVFYSKFAIMLVLFLVMVVIMNSCSPQPAYIH